MNKIQDWTILHSIGSHKGSSSTIRASAEKTKNSPMMKGSSEFIPKVVDKVTKRSKMRGASRERQSSIDINQINSTDNYKGRKSKTPRDKITKKSINSKKSNFLTRKNSSHQESS